MPFEGVVDCGMLETQVLGLSDITSPFIVYTGGWRSGKTVFLVAKCLDLGLRNHPAPILYVAPNYRLLEDVFVKEAQKMMARWGFESEWIVSKKKLYLHTSDCRVEVICRSAEKLATLEGLTVGAVIIDEWESCALAAVKVAVARRSMPVAVPQIVLGGIPRGFGPHYHWLRRRKRTINTLISSAIDNHHVDEDFVDETAAGLSNEEIQEKILGLRAMPSERVFTRFNPKLHLGEPCISARSPYANLEWWCDFNVDPMAWALFSVDRERKLFHCELELVVRGTDSERHAAEAVKVTREFKRSVGLDDNHRGVWAITDPHASQRTGVTPVSHTMNLFRAGFSPIDPGSHLVDDGIASVQRALGGPNPLSTNAWPVHLTFNAERAPYVVSCISSQPRNPDGSPNKDPKVGLDHGSDLVRYGIMTHWPCELPRPDRRTRGA